jgi:hypothetical protein
MSASGVVWIAFANTGIALVCTMTSEMLPPRSHNLLEIVKDYLANLAPQTRRTVVLKILDDVETIRVQPILALRIPLYSVDVHRLVALI